MSLKTSYVHEQKPLTSGNVQTLQIPTSGTIQHLGLIFYTAAGAPVTEAQLRAEVGNIRLTVNGTDIINSTAVRLLDLYEAVGSKIGTPAGINGVLELNLGKLFYTDPVLRDAFGLGTQDVSSIQIQITALTLTNVASVKAVTWRTAKQQNLGAYCSFIDYPQSFNATGDHTVDTLPRDQNAAYLGVFADDGASGTITFGECRVNNASVYSRTDSALNALQLSNNGSAQVSGYYAYLFADGTLDGRLPMVGVSDLRFITTFSVAPGAGGYTMSALTIKNLPSNV